MTKPTKTFGQRYLIKLVNYIIGSLFNHKSNKQYRGDRVICHFQWHLKKTCLQREGPQIPQRYSWPTRFYASKNRYKPIRASKRLARHSSVLPSRDLLIKRLNLKSILYSLRASGLTSKCRGREKTSKIRQQS